MNKKIIISIVVIGLIILIGLIIVIANNNQNANEITRWQ